MDYPDLGTSCPITSGPRVRAVGWLAAAAATTLRCPANAFTKSGISGYDCKETTDEDPVRVATLRALVWAYLRSQLYAGDRSWDDAVAALQKSETPIATTESR